MTCRLKLTRTGARERSYVHTRPPRGGSDRAPHFPLHAHEEDTARYREKYRVGWKAIREERWKKLQSLGIAGGQLSKVERDVGPPYHFPDALETLGPGETNRPLPWDTLTPEHQRFQAEKMAIHAAMVYRMDVDIGRVIAQIRSMKALENTLVLFLSDNGASAEIMVRDDGHDPKAAPGSAASHLCLGPGWSTASNTPFRRHKTWVHEGGVATPFIAHWPAGFLGKNELRHTPAHVIDIVPTILEITRERGSKLSHPPDAPPFSGRSLTSVFQSDGDLGRPYTWWEHGGNRAIRVGPWKLVASGKDQTARPRGAARQYVGSGPGELPRRGDQRPRRRQVTDAGRPRPNTVIHSWAQARTY